MFVREHYGDAVTFHFMSRCRSLPPSTIAVLPDIWVLWDHQCASYGLIIVEKPWSSVEWTPLVNRWLSRANQQITEDDLSECNRRSRGCRWCFQDMWNDLLFLETHSLCDSITPDEAVAILQEHGKTQAQRFHRYFKHKGGWSDLLYADADLMCDEWTDVMWREHHATQAQRFERFFKQVQDESDDSAQEVARSVLLGNVNAFIMNAMEPSDSEGISERDYRALLEARKLCRGCRRAGRVQ
jgi:hypothetical protein